MGAESFVCSASGKTAQEAFDAAVAQAEYDYGHSGYTGTIAEKESFVTFPEANNTEEAYRRAQDLIDEDHEAIFDKWGPAGCIRVTESDRYVFFGWAPS